MKFWPQDWSDDPALRSCSFAAQGLWMRLICLAHFSKPYGHVLIGGKIPTSAQLARVVGGTETEVQSLLDELENQGVFERSRAGGIQSRRMMRDAAASEKGRKSVKKRWSQDTENTEEIEPPNRVNGKHHIGTLIVQEAEAEAEKKEPPNPPAKAKASKGSQAELAPVPDWVPQPAWDDFVGSRVEMKKPLTSRAQEILLKRLDGWRERGLDIEEALNAATVNRWQGVFEPKPSLFPSAPPAKRPTCDPRYFGQPPEAVRALPEPPWSTPEHEAWIEAGYGRIMRMPENAHVG